MENTTTLPTLTGSEKQIEWAEKIRTEKLAEIEKFVATLNQADGRYTQVMGFVEKVRQIEKSSVWIDNRNHPGSYFLRMVHLGSI